MTMRTTMNPGLVVLLVASSCLNPDDIFPLRGTVETQGQRVTLERSPRATRDDCGADFITLKETDANQQLEYGFEIFRAQAQSLTTGWPFCFRVSTTYASGTKAWGVTSDVQSGLDFPLLPDWQATPFFQGSVEWFPDGGSRSSRELAVFPRIAYQRPEDYGFIDRVAVTLTGADGVVQWRQGDTRVEDLTMAVTRTPLTADERVLNEFGGGSLRATGEYTRASRYIDGLDGELRTEWSPTVTALSGATLELVETPRTPPSRGAACEGFTGCPFTDGVLAPAEVNDGAITLHFAQPLSARLVVLRGVVTPYVGPRVDLPFDPDMVVLAAFNVDGGIVSEAPGVAGLLASATFVHDPDGPPVRRDGGVTEYPPTYLAIPVRPSEPISSLRLQMNALRVEEISVWNSSYSVQ